VAHTLIRSEPYLMFFAHLVLDSGNTIEPRVAHRVVLKRQQVVVTVAAVMVRLAAHQHARPGRSPALMARAGLRSLYPEAPTLRTGCESGLKGSSRILRPDQGFAGTETARRSYPNLVGGKVSVGVNESGRTVASGIDPFRVGRYFGAAAGPTLTIFVAFNANDLIGSSLPCLHRAHSRRAQPHAEPIVG